MEVLQPALILTAGRDPVLKASMVESLKMKESWGLGFRLWGLGFRG